MKNSSSFFANRDCEYFPCHKGADPENFNCLFCYCPFYLLGDECHGRCTFLDNGFKDCSACTYPHQPENYDAIVSRYREIVSHLPPRSIEEDEE